ncbi:MAG: sigma-70 family RNA polymerase sigma factor [Bacteroidota bacterium]|nr:sigma-70 family RNA polymerase sigma factor [Bacteroidota bacterium]
MKEYLTDKELVTLYKSGDEPDRAFQLIVEKFQERLYWHIRKMVILHEDADDLLQKVFIKVWKGLENFREESKLYTWLYRIATNETITFLNKKKKERAESFEVYENYLSNNLEADSFFDGNEIQAILQKAILTLPEKQRVVFNMKYFDEIKYKEMSEILDTSEGALKASYHHAVKKIETFVKNNSEVH